MDSSANELAHEPQKPNGRDAADARGNESAAAGDAGAEQGRRGDGCADDRGRTESGNVAQRDAALDQSRAVERRAPAQELGEEEQAGAVADRRCGGRADGELVCDELGGERGEGEAEHPRPARGREEQQDERRAGERADGQRVATCVGERIGGEREAEQQRGERDRQP